MPHANGWPKVYFNLGLFGITEFDGDGGWQVANERLGIYNDEGVLADSRLDVKGVMPIAAGKGMRHLMVIVRHDWDGAGTAVWFDGGEPHRDNNFTEFWFWFKQRDGLGPV